MTAIVAEKFSRVGKLAGSAACDGRHSTNDLTLSIHYFNILRAWPHLQGSVFRYPLDENLGCWSIS